MGLYLGEQTICTAKGRAYAFAESDILEQHTGYRYCVGDANTVDSAIRSAVLGKDVPQRDFIHGQGMARFYVIKQAAKRAYMELCN
jgi:capsule polysaccharide export protein KpsE/RkpR